MTKPTIAVWVTTLLATSSVAAQTTRPLVVAGSWSGFAIQTEVAEKFSEERNIGVRVLGISNRRSLQYLAEKKIDVAIFSPSPKLSLDESLRKHFPTNVSQVNKYVVGHFTSVVVVNRLNSINRLTLEQLRKIYTGKVATWQNGGKIVRVAQRPETKAFQIVSDAILTGPHDCFSADLVMLPNSDGVRGYVAKHAKAIGFCADPHRQMTKVKVLSVSAGAVRIWE